MKNIKIIAVLLCLGYVGLQDGNAQATKKQENKVLEIKMREVPESVKETLKSYANYEISQEVSYELKSSKGKSQSDKIYKFKIERKNFPYVLLVNEKGKVMGIETEEGQ